MALRRSGIASNPTIHLRAFASRLMVPVPAEPDIHLLPQAPKSRRRRLSLCSLPVPKQCEVSLKSFLRCPGDLLQDLAACASNDLVLFFLITKVFKPSDLALRVDMTSCILHGTADRLLVKIQSDVIHIVSEQPRRLFSESASRRSSAFRNTSYSSST